jgi:hypothetical protein
VSEPEGLKQREGLRAEEPDGILGNAEKQLEIVGWLPDAHSESSRLETSAQRRAASATPQADSREGAQGFIGLSRRKAQQRQPLLLGGVARVCHDSA